MTRTVASMALAAGMLMGGAAFAQQQENAWGTAEDSEKCAKEFTAGSPNFVNGGYVQFKNGAPYVVTNVSPECKAEIDKRAEDCLKDPAMVKQIEEAKGKDNRSTRAIIVQKGGEQGPHMLCADQGFLRMKTQREKAAKEKAEAEARHAAAANTKMPQALKKDPGVEKQVTTTYKKAFPDAKVLKVVVVGAWSTERNNLGVILGRNIQVAVVNQQKDVCEIYNELWQQEYRGGKFVGPLLERGAGSLQRSEILCSNVK